MREHETSARTYFVDLPDEAAAAARKVLLAYRPSTRAEPGRANLHADATLESIWNALTDGRLIDPTTMAEAVASARAEGWQPIETAPKDGTPILGYGAGNSRYPDEKEARQTRWRFYDEGSIAHAEFLKGKGPSGAWEWNEPHSNWGSSWKPTHWMPLPAPPTLIPGGRTDV